MAVKIALDSFLAVARRSNLVTKDQLTAMQEAYQREGSDPESSRRFAEYLVKQKVLTGWQAEKLLQGKHKGFFLGKYRLLALLGKGGMSSVYLAEHVLMRRRCAIKVLPTRRVHDASYLARFHREAQAVAALDHPNIVRAYDVDHEIDGEMEIHFLVMEFVDGKSLLEIVQSQGPLSPARAAEYVRQAALGLAHAHKAGLVHRDIKPGNLLVDNAGVVKVLDLGLARFFETKEDVSLTVQHDERVLGTADYLAPEQAVDSHGVDARADFYSLGCTLYFCLTGLPPFTQGTLAQRLMAHQTKDPPPVESHRSDLSPHLAQIVRKMMMKRPEDRYASAGDVAKVLQEWLERQSNVDSPTEVASPASRQPTPFPGAAAETSIRPTVATSRPAPPRADEIGNRPTSSRATAATARATPRAEVATQVEPELGAFLWRLNVESTGDMPIYSPDGSDSAIVSSETRQKVLGEEPRARKPATNASGDTLLRSAPLPTSSPPETLTSPAQNARGAAPTTETGPAFPTESALSEPAGIGSSVIRRRSNSKQTLTAYIIAAAVFAVVSLTLFIASRGDGTDNPRPPGDLAPSPDLESDPDPAQGASLRKLGPELSVGPTGDFRTISAALDYITSHSDQLAAGETWRVAVSGGRTYEDRIVARGPSFGLPRGVVIESIGGSPAVLKSTGPGPVVALDGAEYLTLRGLTIDAAGAEVAVAVNGFVYGTRLEDLTIQGYTSAGVASGEIIADAANPARYVRITFQPASENTTGIRVEDVRHLVIDQCRLIGPMQSGIDFTSSTWNSGVSVRQCLFHEMRAGIHYRAQQPDVQNVSFINNTFHRVRHGILFEHVPSVGSTGLTVHHNLFVEVNPGPEFMVSAGVDAPRAEALLGPGAARNNWSQRASHLPQTGELDVFSQDGRRGAEIGAFVSRDPASPDFLKPASPTVRIELKTPAPNAEPYVGASAP